MFDRNADELPPVTVISHNPAFLSAWLWEGSEYGTVDADTLVVYRSLLVEETDDELFGPISEFLSDYCFRDESTELVEDDEMMGGETERRLVLVFRTCPRVYSHWCRADRMDLTK
jgi:hypothetical protein